MSVIDRRQLGSMLRQARQARGLTLQQVVTQLNRQNVTLGISTLTQWEQGKRSPRPQDLVPLMQVLEIADTQVLRDLARAARQRNWWSQDAAALRNSFTQLMGLEADACVIAEYSATVLPGLLQTREYAAAIMAAASPPLTGETITTRIDIRLERQRKLLDAETPTQLQQLHVVLDEGCLRLRVGGDTVWHDQLRHLLKLGQRRDIIVQVLPFVVGAHAGTMGGFTLLDFTDADPVAYVELASTDVYFEGDQAGLYRLRFDKLREQALPEPLSLRLIEEVADGKS